MKIKRVGINIFVIALVLAALTGCTIPGFGISNTNSNSSPDSLLSTPAIPSPINPEYTATAMPTMIPGADLPDFVSVIAKVRPSVVAINTQVPALNIFGSTFTQEGAGSGWIIDSTGLIVTNNHVVEGANNISVTLEDGRNYTVDTVRTDATSDLAVLKVNAQNLPPALKVGDSSQLQVGDWVVAIGNSLGQGISATKGIVSALGVSVSLDTETLYDLIQTDAAINPGNSGGPLIDLAGDVVGINSIKVARVGVEGMGYAISAKEAIPIIDDLVKTGYVVRPWMGARLYTVDQTVVFRYRLGVNKGVLVTQITANGPADVAGLKPGDVITTIESKEVASVDDLNHIIHSYQIGQQIKLTYYRGNSQNSTDLVLAETPPPSSS
jgi:serine protease Do